MPAPSLAFGLPTTILTNIAAINIDAVLSERHRYENLVTEHPIEDGSPISDHVVNKPVVVEMEGRFTDTPFSFLTSIASGAAGLLGANLGVDPAVVAGATSLIGASLPGKSKLAFQELVALNVKRETFTVLTGIHEYENMIFQSLEFPRAPADGRSLRFRATLKEIIVIGVTAQTNSERVADEVANSSLLPNNRGTIPNIGI